MSDDQATPDVDERVATVVKGADLTEVVDALIAGRTRILARWLEVASRQPFHQDRPDLAVTDHIPDLFDATVAAFKRDAGPESDSAAPMDDPAVIAAASAHAALRFEQGLGPIAVVTEFRLLRQEISRALGDLLDESVPAADVVAGLALVGDALDGAATVGLEALSERIEAMREGFLATTMHDVRQPITLVEGSLQLAYRWLDGPQPDVGRLRESVDDALSATHELVAVLDTLNDASRVATGALDPDTEPVSLEGVVRETAESLGPAARARISVISSSQTHLIGLWDAGLLKRLVANLLGNALKYSAPDGAVTVILEPGGAGRARLSVTDEGLGMTADELTTAFDRFVRADRARRSGIPGLGLGLYACRGIVAAHGGTIAISSPGPDRGTTIVVELPLMEVESDD
jgi:signal transduction histidine kinase